MQWQPDEKSLKKRMMYQWSLMENSKGNMLFDICFDVIRTGQVGRPKTTLEQGVKVRVKNKGSQAHQTGAKRPLSQAPQPEHPKTKPNLEDKDIHAKNKEAFNSALRL